MDSWKKYFAEALGTFTLTLFGCGSAAIAGSTLGTLGIAFAFGLSIVAMAFAIGNVSGCHIDSQGVRVMRTPYSYMCKLYALTHAFRTAFHAVLLSTVVVMRACAHQEERSL